MRETPFGDFVDTVSVPAPTDPAARDRQIETACYGEPATPEGGGFGLVIALWRVGAAGLVIGHAIASRCSQ